MNFDITEIKDHVKDAKQKDLAMNTMFYNVKRIESRVLYSWNRIN